MIDATKLLNTLIEGKDLSADEARGFFDAVVSGEIPPAQIAGILVALRMKGESTEEIEGLVRAMRSHMVQVEASGAIDVVGTGGDRVGPFNISTAAAFVAAGVGVKVAKHGNRSASSKCGSADVLEALGVKIDLTAKQAEVVFQNAGIVFLFAPNFHPATKNVVAVRKELKVRTIFNILGPLLNPAGVKRQLLGAADAAIGKKIADVATSLGYEHLLVVSSEDGMDKISLSGKTQAFEIMGGKIRKFVIDPEELGFKKIDTKEILGGSTEENAAIIRRIFDGTKDAKRDIVVLNAAFALVVSGIAKNPKEGIALAERSIDSGAAKQALEKLVEESQRV